MMIRKAQTTDLAGIQNLYTLLFQHLETLEPEYLQEATQDEAFIESAIRGENNFTLFVLEEEEVIQGFAMAQLQDSPPYAVFVPQRCVYLMDLVVLPTTRGKGYGTALIEHVKNWGIENQVDYFELTVMHRNQQAIALYEREGFRPFSQSMRMRLDAK